MKFTSILLLALLTLPARAADPLTYAQALECVPAPFGSGSSMSIRSNELGDVFWHFCKNSKGEWGRPIIGVFPGGIPAAGFQAAVSMLKLQNPLPAFRAAAAKNMTISLNDPRLTVIWKRYSAEMVPPK